MSTPEREQRPGAVARPDAVPSSPSVGVTAWADQWGLVLTLGLVTFGLGFVLTFWPEATLRILAVLVSVQLLLTGFVSIVGAVASRTSDRGTRTIVWLSGIFGVLVGLVLLRAPQQTVAVVGLLLGLWWVFKGLVDVVGALSPTRSSSTPRGGPSRSEFSRQRRGRSSSSTRRSRSPCWWWSSRCGCSATAS